VEKWEARSGFLFSTGTINVGRSMSMERVILSSADEARFPSAQTSVRRHRTWMEVRSSADHDRVNNRKPPQMFGRARIVGRDWPSSLWLLYSQWARSSGVVPPPSATTSASTSSPGSMPGRACRWASSIRIGPIARTSERANLDLFFIPRSAGWRELFWECSCRGVLFRSFSPFCCLPQPVWPFARWPERPWRMDRQLWRVVLQSSSVTRCSTSINAVPSQR